MKCRWLVLAMVILISGFSYWSWVVGRTKDFYTGFSMERVRYAHLSHEQRLRLACLGARARLDASQGHSRGFCLRFLKQGGLHPWNRLEH